MTFAHYLTTPYSRHLKHVIRCVVSYLLILLVILLSAIPSQAKGKRTVEDVRYRSAPDATRVVIVIDGPVQHAMGRLLQPDRLYIDLQQTRLAPGWAKKKLDVGDGRLHAVRIAQNRLGIVRVVLDLPIVPHYTVFTLRDPYRIVVDLQDQPTAAPTPVAKASAKPKPKSKPKPIANPKSKPSAHPKPKLTKPLKAKLEKPPKTKTATKSAVTPSAKAVKTSSSTSPPTPRAKPPAALKTIVIDPGHGGKDPGALGPRGIEEKQVVLRVALELRDIIRQTLPRYRVVLTREKDVLIPLAERVSIANRHRADVFISIHANASERRKVRGIETWYFSFAANTERAQRIAARENNMSTQQLSELERILRDLQETDRINQSAILAGMTQNSLVDYMATKHAKIPNRGVDGAPFMVLLRTDMPSVLVEIGFVSNPKEAKRLRSRRYQQALAKGIFKGIREFLRQSVVSVE